MVCIYRAGVKFITAPPLSHLYTPNSLARFPRSFGAAGFYRSAEDKAPHVLKCVCGRAADAENVTRNSASPEE